MPRADYKRNVYVDCAYYLAVRLARPVWMVLVAVAEFCAVRSALRFAWRRCTG